MKKLASLFDKRKQWEVFVLSLNFKKFTRSSFWNEIVDLCMVGCWYYYNLYQWSLNIAYVDLFINVYNNELLETKSIFFLKIKFAELSRYKYIV